MATAEISYSGLDALLTPEESVLLLVDHQAFQFANPRRSVRHYADTRLRHDRYHQEQMANFIASQSIDGGMAKI